MPNCITNNAVVWFSGMPEQLHNHVMNTLNYIMCNELFDEHMAAYKEFKKEWKLFKDTTVTLKTAQEREKNMMVIDLSLKGEVSCTERGMCKLPQLENYELSLMQ